MQRTNMVHLNARVVGAIPRRSRVVVVTAGTISSKGEISGQAIQNANLMLGLPETAGLL